MKTKGILLMILILLTIVSTANCSVILTNCTATPLGFGEGSNAWAVDDTGGILVESSPDDSLSTGYYVNTISIRKFAENIIHEGGPFGPILSNSGTIAYANWNYLLNNPTSITFWKDGVETTSPSTMGVTKINSVGEIAGAIPKSWTEQTASFRTADGVVKEISKSPTGEYLKPTAVDDDGKVYLSTESIFTPESYIWDDGNLAKLETPWGKSCKVIAATSYGILGCADYRLRDGAPLIRKVFILKDGSFTEIPTLPGAEDAAYNEIIPTAMNGRGQVTINHKIGLASNGWNPISKGFVYDDATGSFTQLAGVDDDYGFATAINDSGLVVGNIVSLNGRDIAVKWSTVPEPSTFLPLSIGLLGLIGFRRRR